MIKTDIASNNVLRITAPEKLNADDFHQITPQVDSIISRYGKIRLLIDASAFNGWENIAAFKNHAGSKYCLRGWHTINLAVCPVP